MSKVLVVIAAVAALAGCSNISAQGAPPQGKTETVTGKVIDLVCHGRNPANTEVDHDAGRVCAIACIKWEGNPAGLLTADGKLYQLTGGVLGKNNIKIADHIAHMVTVTGTVYEKAGMTMLSSDTLTMVSK
jgi:hypothetical protein